MIEKTTGFPTEELLSVKNAAALLNCSERTVYRLADAGRLPRPVKLGSLVRWRKGELTAWIADGCQPVRTPRKGGTPR